MQHDPNCLGSATIHYPLPHLQPQSSYLSSSSSTPSHQYQPRLRHLLWPRLAHAAAPSPHASTSYSPASYSTAKRRPWRVRNAGSSPRWRRLRLWLLASFAGSMRARRRREVKVRSGQVSLEMRQSVSVSVRRGTLTTLQNSLCILATLNIISLKSLTFPLWNRSKSA